MILMSFLGNSVRVISRFSYNSSISSSVLSAVGACICITDKFKGCPLNLATIILEFTGLYPSNANLALEFNRNSTPSHDPFPLQTRSLLRYLPLQTQSISFLPSPGCHIDKLTFRFSAAPAALSPTVSSHSMFQL